MSELIIADDDRHDVDPPSYKEPGRVLVEVIGPCDSGIYEWECEFHDHDGSTFWIQEGIGFDYWFNEMVIGIAGPGWYVVEGITGHYYRGEWGYTDDDEDWEYESVRPATEGEISSQALTYILE